MCRDARAFNVLGIDSGASTAEIRRAYLEKAKECHPDANPDDNDAHEKFQQVQWAYDKVSSAEFKVAEFELSQLDLYKETIRNCIKECDLSVNVPELWGMITDDGRVDIDADLVMGMIDLCAFQTRLPYAIKVMRDVEGKRIKNKNKKDILQLGYNRLLSHCDQSLRKQQESGKYFVELECSGKSVTMTEVVEALQAAGLNPDTQTHMYLMQNARRMHWICV